MCRLFAMASKQHPFAARFWLVDASDSLVVQSHREPDGTGLGWFDMGDGAPRVLRDPMAAWQDTKFIELADDVVSTRFVAHVRFASTGGVDISNTHPFEQEQRLFAHNGVVEGLDALREHLGEDAALAHGETDSELTFALVTREIRAAGGDVAAGIERAGAWIAEHLPVYAWNIVLATSDELFALRWPDVHELWWLDRAAGGHPTQEHAGFEGTRSREPMTVASGDLAHHPAVVVASEPMDDHPDWQQLASGELLHVDAGGAMRIRSILPNAPRHPLTLDQLDDTAAASQGGSSGLAPRGPSVR